MSIGRPQILTSEDVRARSDLLAAREAPLPSQKPSHRSAAVPSPPDPGARPQSTNERQGLHSYGVGTICAVPGRLVRPGPGRAATPSIVELVLVGMQKPAARIAPL